MKRLREFAYAAATRYSGPYLRPTARPPAGPLWTAWNEPNLPLGLKPQWRKVDGRWVIQSAPITRGSATRSSGVHPTLLPAEGRLRRHRGARKQRAGGTQAVRLAARVPARDEGGGCARLRRLRAPPVLRRDAETPAREPPGRASRSATSTKLVREVTILYGEKPIWITEYGYQTNPPDRVFGVTWASRRRTARGVHDREGEPADRHAALVPRPGRRADDRLAVRVSCRPAGCGNRRSTRSASRWPLRLEPRSSASSPGRWRRQSCGRPACSTS